MNQICNALTPDEHTLFVQGVKQGAYRLLLGAGFSASSTGPDGSHLPVGNGLATEIADHFDLPSSYPLAQLANAIDPSLLSEFLLKRFCGCNASTNALLLSEFLWKRIYSYNVDDVIESVYRNANALQRVKSISYRDAFEEVEDLGTVHAVYLHGSVSRPNDGYVFSTQAYARHIDEHAPWQYVFADELTNQPFIVIGCTLNEFDLEVFLSRRASLERLHARAYPSLFVTKTPDKVLEAACKQHGLRLVASTSDDFLADLVAEIPERPSALEVLRPRTVSQFLTASHAAERIFFSQWRHVADALGDDDVSADEDCPHMLTGVEPQWTHARRNELIPRSDVSSATAKIIGWAKSSAKSGIRTFYAPAGSGKSAMLLLVGAALARAGLPVYSLDVNRRISIDAAIEVLRSSQEPVVLICDTIADYIDQLSDLLERLPNRNCRVLIVGADRGTRRQFVDDLAGDLFLESSTVSPLSKDEAFSFVQALRLQGLLGTRAGEADQALASSVLGSDLLPALLELTSNSSFASRMKSEVDELSSTERRIYGIVCLSHQHGYSLKLPVLCTAAGIPMARLNDALSGKLRDLLVLRSSWGDVQSRHRLVAEHAIEMFADRYEYLIALVQALRPYVNRTTIKQRLIESRLAGRLLDADTVAKVVGKRTSQFYSDVADGWQWNSRYWEQRALAVLEADPSAALRFAEQAVGIEEHPMPLTTLARVQFEVAAAHRYASFEDRRLVVSAVNSALHAIELSRRFRRRELHAHDVAIRGAVAFVEHAQGSIDLRQWEGWRLVEEIVSDLPRVKAKASAARLRQMWQTARSRFGI